VKLLAKEEEEEEEEEGALAEPDFSVDVEVAVFAREALG
jgi:hypothetical protein